jgi:hypothetical protein
VIALAWLSLVGLVAGEAGHALGRRTGRQPRWAWLASAAGALTLAVHMLIAMGGHHGWSHEAAVAETRLLTERVYGVAWGGGVYVNYAFLGVWLVMLSRWRASGAKALPAWLTWTWRTAVLIVVSNAAIVFAAPSRQAAGALVTAGLVVSWWLSARPLCAGGPRQG